MSDGLTWVSLAAQQPQDKQVVYARSRQGTPKKVVYYADPERWVGSNIVYDFQYFVEWAALESAERKPPARSQ